MNRILFYITFFILVNFNCKDNSPSYIRFPERQILKEFQNKKIVMLADYGHSMSAPYRSLLKLLNHWYLTLEKGTATNQNIVLVLEQDDQVVDIMKEFISTGNLESVLDFWLPYGCLEDFEFYFDLKMFVEKINRLKKQNNNVSFEILGAEESNIFKNLEFLIKNREESFKYFAYTRDSLAAKRVIKYLNKFQDKKAIIFYGSGHLIKNYTNKDLLNEFPNKQIKGYFLAYYLKKYFGENQVLTVNQVVVPDNVYNKSDFAKEKKGHIFVYSKNIPWNYLNPHDYDAFVLRREIRISGHLNSLIFSDQIVKSCINKMKFLKTYLPGHFAQRYYDIALNSLKFISGEDYDTIEQWETWHKNSNKILLYRLDTEEFSNQIWDYYLKNITNPKNLHRLHSFGFGPGIMNTKSIISRDEWNNKIFPNVLPNLKFLNAVGLYWFGNNAEKKLAKKYLKNYTNLNYYYPAEYLKWWRNNYINHDVSFKEF